MTEIKIKDQKADIKNGFAPIVIIAVLALVIAVGGIGIGLAWRTNYLDKYLPAKVKELLGKEVKPSDQVSDQGEEPGEEPKPEEDKTKDWETYTSEKFGISFKYPRDWNEEAAMDSKPTFLSPDFEEDIVGGPAKGIRLWLSMSENPESKTLEEWLDWSREMMAPFSIGTVREYLTVDDNSAVIIESGAQMWGLEVGATIVVGKKVYDFDCHYPQGSGVAVKDQCTAILKLLLSTVDFLP